MSAQARFAPNGFGSAQLDNFGDYDSIISPSYSSRSSLSAHSPGSTPPHSAVHAQRNFSGNQNLHLQQQRQQQQLQQQQQQQQLQGPSFPYDNFPQQTGPPLNYMPSSVSSFSSLDLGLDDSLTAMDGMQSSESNMGFGEESLFSTPAFFFPENASEDTYATSSSMSAGSTMVPAMDRLNSGPIIPGATLPAGRKVYAGIHQQHAYEQQQALLARQKRKAELKAQQSAPEDPTNARISKLLESMKAKPAGPPNPGQIAKHLPHIAKLKKEEDEMDEDERLLASEEGKKLSSKERRQLRNKVSARAFRSRRKGSCCTRIFAIPKLTVNRIHWTA